MKRTAVIIGICCVVLLGLWAALYLFLSYKRLGGPEDLCSRDHSLVCGIDGATYQNSCSASRAGVQVLHGGTCQSPSSLSADERVQLLWLLRARIGAKMSEVPIRFERTEKGPCDSCVTYYYVWGDPEVHTRLVVRAALVESAVDSTGYDYIAQKQGNPGVIDSNIP